MFGMFVLDQFFVLVLHDPLLDFELGTIRGHLRPEITPLANIQTELQEINPRPLRRHLDRIQMFHFRR
jgi:hypothetical protein